MKGLVSRWARWATSPERKGLCAGEVLRWRLRNVGGGGEANELRKGAGSARPPHACARLAPPGRRPGFLIARPAPTVRTLLEEEQHDPSPPGPEGPAAHFVKWRVVTCFFTRDLGSREREHVSVPSFFVPLPHEEWEGRS